MKAEDSARPDVNVQNISSTKITRKKYQILWFGNSGYEHISGLTDLLLVRDDLERLAQEFDVHLLVVSNNVDLYNKHIKGFKIPNHYLSWSRDLVEKELKTSSVVIVPNPLNQFAKVKSPNRTILALSRGVPVVATQTNAMKDFSGCVEGNFYQGIRNYLTDKSLVKTHLASAAKVIDSKYTGSFIASQWKSLVEESLSAKRSH